MTFYTYKPHNGKPKSYLHYLAISVVRHHITLPDAELAVEMRPSHTVYDSAEKRLNRFRKIYKLISKQYER